MRNKFAFDAIKDVIDAGFELLGRSQYIISDEQFTLWCDYSMKMLALVSKYGHPAIEVNYLRVLLSVRSNHNLTASQKLSSCIDYLIEALKILAN